jgi:hypothetical protein
MYEEIRATNDNDNEPEIWGNVLYPDPRQCLVFCLPILKKRPNTLLMFRDKQKIY